MPIADEQLEKLKLLSDSCIAPPWTSIVEGRDQPLGGDSFIRSGVERNWGPDIYVSAGDFATNAAISDLIAAARTLLPEILSELRELRAARKD